MYLIIKRFFDIFFSIIGIILIVILIPIIKLAYLLYKDYDTIFYFQERIGKNGKIFKLYKFRTMKRSADEILEDILSNKDLKEEWEKNQKLKNDPRVTKVGKFLRKSCIDELPQFLNILKGEMSLIGPRPYLPREKKYIKKDLKKITRLKPGITGYLQVNKDKNESFKERIFCEKYYVDNFSFNLDIKIFFKTFKVFFSKNN